MRFQILLNLLKQNKEAFKRGNIASKINVTIKGVRVSEKLQYSVMKFVCSNKSDLCYYGQINSLRLKSGVASKWTSEVDLRNGPLRSTIYFAGDDTKRSCFQTGTLMHASLLNFNHNISINRRETK